MDVDLQQKLMPLFHYALRRDGYLLLGSSETVGDAADLFDPVDKKWKLFQRRDVPTPQRRLPTSTMPAREHSGRRRALSDLPVTTRVRELAERQLLEKHIPACVVIDSAGEVLYIHGHTGRYLEPPAGEPSGSLFKLARQGLRLDLTSGVRKARKQKEAVRLERLRVEADGDSVMVNLVIEPMVGPDAIEEVLLVLFEEVSDPDAANASSAALHDESEQRIANLDRELSAKEEYLRTAVEELETANEELKATNEEMQSMNEELQSTNEELETSQGRAAVAQRGAHHRQQPAAGESPPALARQQRHQQHVRQHRHRHGVRRRTAPHPAVTPAVTAIMNLIPSDLGRPLADITVRVTGDVDVVATVTTVLDTLATVEAQVTDSSGRVYQMRVQPYRTLENVIEGGVLTFVDVTERHRLQASLDELAQTVAEAGEFAQSVLDTVREPQLVVDEELNVVTANKAFLATFEEAPDAVIGRHLGEIYGGAWAHARTAGAVLEGAPGEEAAGGLPGHPGRRHAGTVHHHAQRPRAPSESGETAPHVAHGHGHRAGGRHGRRRSPARGEPGPIRG